MQAAQRLDHTLTEIDKKEEKANADHLENLLETYKDYAAEREETERKHGKAIAELRSHLSDERLAALGKQMTDRFVGNVDLLARPMIDAARLAEKGWQDAGEGIATVFSSQFGIDDAAGKRHEILVTPILPNGDVLSEAELNAYIDESLNGAEDILKADTLGLVIAVDVDPDGTAGEALHRLQEKYYALKQDTEAMRLPMLGYTERSRSPKIRRIKSWPLCRACLRNTGISRPAARRSSGRATGISPRWKNSALRPIRNLSTDPSP